MNRREGANYFSNGFALKHFIILNPQTSGTMIG